MVEVTLAKLSAYLTAINYSKVDVIEDDPVAEKEYVPFVINRCLSYFIDTILYVNEVNQYPDIPKRMQFIYLKDSIRKNKRFSKWLKAEKIDNLELIQEYYGYNNKKAREALLILTPENIDEIKERMYTGGIKRI